MIASERNLAPPHQNRTQPKQHRQPPTTTKNGIKKPIRPVKLYVIDPRQLKQKLEACAAKNKEKEREAEKSKINEDGLKVSVRGSKEKAVNVTATQTPTSNVSTTTTFSTTKESSTLTNILPPLVTNFTTNLATSVTTPATVTVSQNGTAVMGNGVTLQCINAAGFVPALPLVVTNGVALLQQPIVQSSIAAGGIFLPGITAIPGVIGGGATIIGAHPPKIQPKIEPKPKKKKKPKRKKRKLKPKVDDDDDTEMTYLLKETTTRNGRVSRPITQSHSTATATTTTPTPIKNISLANSSAPPPEPEAEQEPDKKKPRYNCVVAEVKVNLSTRPPVDPNPQYVSSILPKESQKSQTNSCPSTNTNDQDEVIVPISTLNSGLENNTIPSTTFSTPPQLPILPSNVNVLEPIQRSSNQDQNPPSFNQFQLSLPTTSFEKEVLPINSTGVANCITYASSPNTAAMSSLPPLIPYPMPPTYLNCGGKNVSNSESTYAYSTISASLVPNSEEPIGLFVSTAPSVPSGEGVDVVPSSYSIPSSPPSQCQSPGLPDHTESSERACHSPVDPMLLRSRSPFPPPVHADISLPSVSLSNLTIPEESLCKGELFMDLGDGILENSSLSTRLSRFCGDSVGPLFPTSHSPLKLEASTVNNEQSNGAATVAEEDLDLEPEGNNDPPASPSPHVSAPVLLETTEDANDGEIFQTANYARQKMFAQPQATVNALVLPSCTVANSFDNNENVVTVRSDNGRPQMMEFPKTPQSSMVESDLSMDGAETVEPKDPKRRSIWQFVKDQIKFCGISQACGEISEVAEKLSRIARDQFIPIREEEIERLGSNAPIIHVDTPFFSHLLDLPFGTYIFKEDVGRKKKLPPPPPLLTSSELSFTCGVEDVEKFLAPDIDLISLPHLTNLDLN